MVQHTEADYESIFESVLRKKNLQIVMIYQLVFVVFNSFIY